jgi:amidase
VAEQKAAMEGGKTSAAALAKGYLARIKAIDKRTNAVMTLNPDALKIAAGLDRERKAGKVRGPLHGIPVLLKDNIATGDAMPTTAGSLALAGVKATRDAFIAAQLRAAGAVILGKTNLSEWANMRSNRSTSGWSGVGGQTRNPYALDRNTSGSSSGSAAAAAASLATLTVGTETDGSIVSPSAICGIVGMKPTVGLVSRSGIIPISSSQDTAGPMARTVSDCAYLLTALAGNDPEDPANVGRGLDYTKALTRDGLLGMRIGVARSHFNRNPAVQALIDRQLLVLKEQGAVLVDPVTVPNAARVRESELEVLLYEFKPGLAHYLREYAPHAPVRTMADVIAFNERERARALRYFGQEWLAASNGKGGLDDKAYLDAVANNQKYARDEGLDKVMKEHRLDALVAPTTGLAWLIDYINGDAGSNGFAGPAAVAGYPHVTVPAGYLHGLPVGLSFVGGAYSEAALIGMAYAYEQATRHRRAPAFAASAVWQDGVTR